MFESFKKYFKKPRVYLDYAAATPLHPDVQKVMDVCTKKFWANPSAIHKEGQEARKMIDDARLSLARTLVVRPQNVVFTGNGTESNNLAIFGTIEKLHEGGTSYKQMEVISTRMEHPSIIEALAVLEERGVKIHYLKVDKEGLIEEDSLHEFLNKKTVLITFAYANSEIGTIQDVKRVTRIVKKYNTEHETNIRVHLDASQCPLWLPCQVDMLGIDLITLDAGKCYGPKGIGVLAMRHGVELRSEHVGGEQEQGLRAGTESAPLIIGCVHAIVRAQKEWELRSTKVRGLRDKMISRIEKHIPGAVLNGPRAERIANNVNISIPGIQSEFAVVTLDAKGIAASTKSACSSESGGASKVVREISGDDARASSTIRFSLGEETSEGDITYAVDTLAEHILKMQEFAKFYS